MKYEAIPEANNLSFLYLSRLEECFPKWLEYSKTMGTKDYELVS